MCVLVADTAKLIPASACLMDGNNTPAREIEKDCLFVLELMPRDLEAEILYMILAGKKNVIMIHL